MQMIAVYTGSDHKVAESLDKTITSAFKGKPAKCYLVAGITPAEAKSGTVTYTGTFLWPSQSYTRIGRGLQGNPPRYQPGHGGVDLPTPSGRRILAVAPGKVVTACYHSSWGNYVVINHGKNLYTLYAHNSKLLVTKGQTVRAGQQLALSGSTGVSTGPHCHFEVWSGGNGVSFRKDPWKYLTRPNR